LSHFLDSTVISNFNISNILTPSYNTDIAHRFHAILLPLHLVMLTLVN